MNAAFTLEALREDERKRESLAELIAMAEAETRAVSEYDAALREILPEFLESE